MDDVRLSYEKLEHLGDSVLDVVVSLRLFCALPDKGEGPLSDIRTSLVRNEELWKVVVCAEPFVVVADVQVGRLRCVWATESLL